MDKEAFFEGYFQWEKDEREKNNIGCLKEKPLHAILKNYICPDVSKQEIKIGPYFADIFLENHIYEIQTSNFNVLRKKLEYFLKEYKVTVIYPISAKNRICWINPDTGEIKEGRMSPKKGNPFYIFPELYKIKPFLKNSNLSFKIILLNTKEYRMLDGWSEDRKKGGKKIKKIPVDIIDEVDLKNKNDYLKLIEFLPDNFTVKDFKSFYKISQKAAQCSINILYYMNGIIRIGKEKNAFVYKKSE